MWGARLAAEVEAARLEKEAHDSYVKRSGLDMASKAGRLENEWKQRLRTEEELHQQVSSFIPDDTRRYLYTSIPEETILRYTLLNHDTCNLKRRGCANRPVC
jgi:hypothetical protein